MSEELKPCPFCGGEKMTDCGRRFYCVNCRAMGPEPPTQEADKESVDAWNRRANETV